MSVPLRVSCIVAVVRSSICIPLALSACGRIGFGLSGDADSGTVDATVDTSPDATVLPAGILALYPLSDDPSEGGTRDLANDRTATCIGEACPTLESDGPFGAGPCHLFDGVDDHFDIPSAAVFDSSTAVTVTSWARIDDVSRGYSAIIAKPVGTATGNSWELEFLSGVPTFTGGITIHGGGAVANGEWHHLAGTHDGTTKILYVDGVEVARIDSPLVLDDNTIVIGADYNSGFLGAEFIGCLSDVRIYDRALSAPELAQIAAGNE